MELKKYNKKDVIFREGTYGDCMYRLVSGKVGVYTNYGSIEQIKLTVLKNQEIFGEMGILEAWVRSATIVAETDGTEVMEISSDEVSEYLKNDPEVCKEMMTNLSHRLRELTNDYLDVCRTIQDIKETWGESSKRGPGVIKKIAKFLGFAKLMPSLVPEEQTSLEEIWRVEGFPTEDGLLRKENCKKGQIIFREGDEGSCMYYISYGLVDIFSRYGTEHQELITTLTTHQFFGEMGLIEKLPRSATAVSADSDTNLRIITIEEMDNLFKKNPAMVLMILKHLSGRLRSLTNDYINACKVVAEMSEAEEERRKLGAEYMKSMDYYIAEASRYTNTFVH